MKNAIAIEQPRGNVLQRLNWQYVSLAAGLALAISAVAGLSSSLKSSDAGTISAPNAAPVAAQRFADQSPLRVVLVDNIEQQERLQSQFAADEYVTGYTLQSPPVVAVKGSAIEQSLVGASSVIAANNRHVQVTDLTLPATIATPAAVLKASDAKVPAEHLFFYVVADEVARGALVQGGATHVVVVGSDAHRFLISESVRELVASGTPFTIVDPAAEQRDAMSTQRQLDANIAASVLSMELATYAP